MRVVSWCCAVLHRPIIVPSGSSAVQATLTHLRSHLRVLRQQASVLQALFTAFGAAFSTLLLRSSALSDRPSAMVPVPPKNSPPSTLAMIVAPPAVPSAALMSSASAATPTSTAMVTTSPGTTSQIQSLQAENARLRRRVHQVRRRRRGGGAAANKWCSTCRQQRQLWLCEAMVTRNVRACVRVCVCVACVRVVCCCALPSVQRQRRGAGPTAPQVERRG